MLVGYVIVKSNCPENQVLVTQASSLQVFSSFVYRFSPRRAKNDTQKKSSNRSWHRCVTYTLYRFDSRADARHTCAMDTSAPPPGITPEDWAATPVAVLCAPKQPLRHSAEGNRFGERILTISATCAQQQQHLLTFLTDAVEAYWRGQPAPTLV